MRRQPIPLRKRFFVGCEGESERSYVKFLSDLSKTQNKAVHLDSHILKEGDPLSRLQLAIKIIKRSEAKHGPYSAKFVFCDFDQYELAPARTQLAESRCKENGIKMIWQRPDHEGLLCRHFDRLRNRQLLNKRESFAALQQAWPNYEKNQTAQQIQRVLSMENVLGAAQALPDFKELIVCIGMEAL